MARSSVDECSLAIRIHGMTCESCELLLERKLKHVTGVKNVDVNHRTGIAHLTLDADHRPSEKEIASVIAKAGYSTTAETITPTDWNRRWIDIGASLLVIFAVYKILQTFDLFVLAPSTSGVLSVGGIFLIGLVAGTSSCLAVTGGLLLALAAKHNAAHQAETPTQRFLPLLQFNIGRLGSYFVLGGLVGMLGQVVTLSPAVSGYMNVIIALVMLFLALRILGFVQKGSFPIRPPKKLSRFITSLSDSDHPAAPITLGALTFFLPCGFTQSLQLAALASGNFAAGATIMFVFALGTLPSLLGISAISSVATGTFSRVFLRFSGTLVFVLALFNLQNGLALAGFDIARTLGISETQHAEEPAINSNLQEVSMTITSSGYDPSNITLKAGIPVRWHIDATEANGCTSVMTIPELQISQALFAGENVIEFTPTKTGPLAFMCSMGMVRGSFTVL